MRRSLTLAIVLALTAIGCGARDDSTNQEPVLHADAGGGAETRDAGVIGDASCDPPCPSGTRCGVSLATGTLQCFHICNPPDGCELAELCNEYTRRCEAPRCNGVQCKQGQDCIDRHTGARFTKTAECTCVKYQMAADGGVLPDSDSCSSYGLTCFNASKGPAEGEPWTVGECI